MDIGVYISELLAKNGEISVPGLGFLVLHKVPGYYNENDGKFYPPRSEVRFDPQQIDDDETLAQYIAEQKNISISSAKYFAEKYIATIREDALVKEVHVADLGSFIADQGRLIFIPSQKPISNPAFFGLAPVNMNKTLPPPSPIVTPPAPTTPPERSFSDFSTPERPPSYDYNRPAETDQRQNVYQGGTPYPPPLESTPSTPPPSTPPPAEAPTRDRQALIDAFNASNKGAYAEQGGMPPIQNRRPDIYPPMDTTRPVQPAYEQVEEEDEQRRPIALFILIGLVVVLGVGVFAMKKFMPAKFDAMMHIFSHKKADSAASAKKADTAIIKEPVANIPPPAVDSATRDSLRKIHVADSIRGAKTADSLRKVQKADSIKNAKQLKIDAEKRRKDSIETVRVNKEIARKAKADSAKVAHAAALAEKQLAKKGKPVTTAVVPAPTTPAPAPVNTKVPTPSVQKAVVAAPVSSGSLTFTPVDLGKTWFAVIGPMSASVAEAKIAGLKKIGIDGFAVKKETKIFVAMGAYAKNSEAEAAATKFKQSGVSDAYLIQISK